MGGVFGAHALRIKGGFFRIRELRGGFFRTHLYITALGARAAHRGVLPSWQSPVAIAVWHCGVGQPSTLRTGTR
jgi:hypothetical protein